MTVVYYSVLIPMKLNAINVDLSTFIGHNRLRAKVCNFAEILYSAYSWLSMKVQY